MSAMAAANNSSTDENTLKVVIVNEDQLLKSENQINYLKSKIGIVLGGSDGQGTAEQSERRGRRVRRESK